MPFSGEDLQYQIIHKTRSMKLRYTFRLALLMVVAPLIFPSCSKLTSNLQYDLSLQTASVDIAIPPLADTTASVAMGSAASVYNVDSFIKVNTSNLLGVSNISSVKMVSCTLTLLNPDPTNNFADFENADVVFYTNANTTPCTVASVTGNPNTYADTYDVPVNSATDMSSYMHGTQLTYSLSGKLRKATTDTLHCRVQLKMNVHVHG